MVGTGAARGVVTMVDEEDEVEVVVVVGSLQPNHPGVWQVDVEELLLLLVEVVIVVEAVVVDSSKQPHQPGVLHVSVLVRVDELELLVLVVGSVPLLS